MKCPDCGTVDTIVFESLPKDFELPSKKKIGVVFRRRRCRICQVTWTSIETEAKARFRDYEIIEILFKHFSIEDRVGEGIEGLGQINKAGGL